VVLSDRDAETQAAFSCTNAGMVMVSFRRHVSGMYPRTDTPVGRGLPITSSGVFMRSIRTFTVLAMLAAAVPAWSQSTAAQAPATPSAWSQNMDKQMQSMQEMRNKLLAARTPEERSRLMTEQMKLMQGGMDMMGGMGMGGMRGMGPMGAASAPMDMSTRQQMMEARIEMMQMMMDRTAPVPAAK
jgi:hypothetical protein